MGATTFDTQMRWVQRMLQNMAKVHGPGHPFGSKSRALWNLTQRFAAEVRKQYRATPSVVTGMSSEARQQGKDTGYTPGPPWRAARAPRAARSSYDQFARAVRARKKTSGGYVVEIDPAARHEDGKPMAMIAHGMENPPALIRTTLTLRAVAYFRSLAQGRAGPGMREGPPRISKHLVLGSVIMRPRKIEVWGKVARRLPEMLPAYMRPAAEDFMRRTRPPW